MAIFLDASFFIALYIEKDIHHEQALALAKAIETGEYGQAITSDDVFDEAVSVVLRKEGRQDAKMIGTQIRDSIYIMHGNKSTFLSAFKIFNSTGEPFSFTDCTTQALMSLAQIQHIATFDKQFRKLDMQVLPEQ